MLGDIIQMCRNLLIIRGRSANDEHTWNKSYQLAKEISCNNRWASIYQDYPYEVPQARLRYQLMQTKNRLLSVCFHYAESEYESWLEFQCM